MQPKCCTHAPHPLPAATHHYYSGYATAFIWDKYSGGFKVMPTVSLLYDAPFLTYSTDATSWRHLAPLKNIFF